MRRFVGVLFVFLFIWLSLYSVRVSAHLTQTCPTSQPVVQGQYGRLINSSSLMTEPNGNTVEKLEKGWEVMVVEGPVCEGNKLWWGVETFGTLQQGWISDTNVEFADQSSTVAMRKYGNEWCVATPLETKAVRRGSLSLPRHWLIFDETVNVENSTFTLLFNGKPLTTRNYEVEKEDGVEIILTRVWALQHSGLRPIWSDRGFWQLTYRCEDLVLPTHTPTPLSSALTS